MSWTFKPPRWATITTLILVPCLCALGYWQLQRGWSKQDLLEQYEQAGQGDRRNIDRNSIAQPLRVEPARVRGHYDAARQMLLDNQSNDGRPGYQVLTPLMLADGGLVIVNRGWIPRAAAAAVSAQLSALPADEVSLNGLWRTLASPAMRLSVDNCSQAGDWPRIVQYPTAEDLRCLLAAPVADGMLLLSADAADGYARQWQQSAELTPTKNYGYAAQWFAFALTLFGIYLKLNLRRTP